MMDDDLAALGQREVDEDLAAGEYVDDLAGPPSWEVYSALAARVAALQAAAGHWADSALDLDASVAALEAAANAADQRMDGLDARVAAHDAALRLVAAWMLDDDDDTYAVGNAIRAALDGAAPTDAGDVCPVCGDDMAAGIDGRMACPSCWANALDVAAADVAGPVADAAAWWCPLCRAQCYVDEDSCCTADGATAEAVPLAEVRRRRAVVTGHAAAPDAAGDVAPAPTIGGYRCEHCGARYGQHYSKCPAADAPAAAVGAQPAAGPVADAVRLLRGAANEARLEYGPDAGDPEDAAADALAAHDAARRERDAGIAALCLDAYRTMGAVLDDYSVGGPGAEWADIRSRLLLAAATLAGEVTP